MSELKTGIRVFVHKNYSDSPLTLEDELTKALRSLTWTTALPGGFKACYLTARMRLGRAWQYLDREGHAGRHFHHLQIMEGHDLRWEGRIMLAGIRWRKTSALLRLTALGYYSSLRDQRITTVDYSGGSPTGDSIIKAMLTDKCPDINSDQGDIDAVSGTVNLTLPDDKYPMDHIIDTIAPLGDDAGNIYYFAVWDDRKAEYKARSISKVDWEVPLSSSPEGEIVQAAQHLRNGADAYDKTTRTASAADTDSPGPVPGTRRRGARRSRDYGSQNRRCTRPLHRRV